jgi:hypothetical protein
MAGQKPKLTAKHFDPEVLRRFDKYVHGGIDRRGFLDGAAKFAQAQQVPACGAAPALDKVAAIKARLLMVFADNDERINAMWPPYESALKAAWQRTITLFNSTLRG